jgi:hypothetical protein
MLMKTKEKTFKRGRKWRLAQEGSDAKSVTTKALRHGEKTPNLLASAPHWKSKAKSPTTKALRHGEKTAIFLASAPLWWRDVAAGLPRQSSPDFQVALAR